MQPKQQTEMYIVKGKRGVWGEEIGSEGRLALLRGMFHRITLPIEDVFDHFTYCGVMRLRALVKSGVW
jgi:hypothetical protein